MLSAKKRITRAALLTCVLIAGCSGSSSDLSTLTTAPVAESVSPAYGSYLGNTPIVISGSGFGSGARIQIGTGLCRPTAITSTAITCITNANPIGVASITVTNPNDKASTLSNSFTYTQSLAITSLTPSFGPSNGGTRITVTGAYFPDSFSALVAGNECTGLTIDSPTQFSCDTPAGTAGLASVTALGNDGQQSILSNSFTYQAIPSGGSVTPATGPVAGGMTITITGSNFSSGASVTVGGGVCTSPTVVSSTQITCLTPANAVVGAKDVVVTFPSTQTVTFTSSYTYVANDAFTRMDVLLGAISSAGGLDGSATTTKWNAPYGIVEAGGLLYVADYSNHVIRTVDPTTGVANVWAGLMGSGGAVNGTGSAARLNAPTGIASDGTSLYVTEGGCAIRRITIATANVSVLAGANGACGSTDAVGAAARFNAPEGIATDGTSVFVADRANHTIRQINIGTGNVTTLAGTAGAAAAVDGIGAAARFNNPYGVATDGTYVYVGDYANHAIRRILIASGSTTTYGGAMGLAGSVDGVGAAARLNGPFQMAMNPANTILYFTEWGGLRIRQLVTATAAVSTLAGGYGNAGHVDGAGNIARFNGPRAVAVDATNVYVAEISNYAIRKIQISNNVVSTLNGITNWFGMTNGSPTATRANGIYNIASLGNSLYFLDRNNCLARSMAFDTQNTVTVAGVPLTCSTVDGVGTVARINAPNGMTSDGTFMYFTESSHTIRRLLPTTGEVLTIAGAAGIAGSTDGVGLNARFSSPRGLANDGSYLYVADSTNHVIRRVDIVSGTTTTFAGTAGACAGTNGVGAAARFCNPYDVTRIGGNLFIADCSNHMIRQIDIATATVTNLAGGGGFADGTGTASARFNCPTAISNDGTLLYVADYNNNAIRKVNPSTGIVATIMGTPFVSYDSGSAILASAYTRNPPAIFWSPNGLYTTNIFGTALFRIGW